MTVYYWVAGLGIVGLISMIGFCLFSLRDIKLNRMLKKNKMVYLVNLGLLLFSILSFGLTIMMFFSLRDQLILLG